MPEMLDPGLEHLHRHGRVWRWTTERRRVVRQLIFDGLALLAIVPLWLFAPGGSWWAPEVVASLIVVSAVASVIRFDIGSGSTSPLMVVHVPLWFAVPPAWIPVVIGASFALGRLIEWTVQADRPPLWRALMGATDGIVTIGPAAVLAFAGSPTVSEVTLGTFALAFLAQAGVDFLIGTCSTWFTHGVKPRVQGRLMVWIIGVDAALAPIGLLGALVMQEQPVALAALIPLILVLGEFARERRDRIDQAVELSTAYRGTAQLMGDVLEADDAYTGGEHTQGVVNLAVSVGLELRLDPVAMRDVEFGALLHDIGKLRVPNAIINKAGPLTDDEWALMRLHPIFGQEMLDRVGGALTQAGVVVRAHHERWDGSGYPDGLRGSEIPIAARIITACDSFSAMTTNRSYRPARTVDAALAELESCAGEQFDPAVVAALKVVIRRDGVVDRRSDLGDIPAAMRSCGIDQVA